MISPKYAPILAVLAVALLLALLFFVGVKRCRAGQNISVGGMLMQGCR